MAERKILVEGQNLIDFYGVNNQKIELFAKQFPKLKIVTRGNEIKVSGEDTEIDVFEEKLNQYSLQVEKYGTLSPGAVKQILNGETTEPGFNSDDIIVFGNSGLVVKARTPNQRKLVMASMRNDMVFAIGPAGSGKTYTAVALAVRALKNKEVRKIILTRPAVEAGENLGFLPGDFKEKLDPYLQPLYDALRDMLPTEKLATFLEAGVIQIAPLAFMRGRTLDNAFVILDEAQNATESQMKMFLTRMGRNAKFIITGDLTQIDLPKKQPSGLIQANRILKNVEGVELVYLNTEDVVRHEIVKRIIDAYDKEESYRKNLSETKSMSTNTLSNTNFNLKGQTSVYHGKVRDVYSLNNDLLVMIASDRISAFDVVLPRAIPYKGQVLNQIASKMMELTKDVVPNWIVGSPVPVVSIGKRCEPFKVEMVVRGYLAGHAAREYKAGKRILCGVELAEGLKENDKLPTPIITPTTKASEGHDMDISREEILKQGIVSEADYVQLEKYTLALYNRGQEIANSRGLILVDTKYEFGKGSDGKIYLIDEIHTPDSSRYFYKEGYEDRQAKGEAQKQLSKEFVRQWLIDNGFQGKEGQSIPTMTDDFVNLVSERYIELFEKITGEKFIKHDTSNLTQRVQQNIENFLNK